MVLLCDFNDGGWSPLGLHGFNCKIQAELQPQLSTLAVCSTAVNACTAIHGRPVVKHDNSREEEAKAQRS